MRELFASQNCHARTHKVKTSSNQLAAALYQQTTPTQMPVHVGLYSYDLLTRWGDMTTPPMGERVLLRIGSPPLGCSGADEAHD
eukprot:1187891-Prorocentrum_minimum.AAC.3